MKYNQVRFAPSPSSDAKSFHHRIRFQRNLRKTTAAAFTFTPFVEECAFDASHRDLCYYPGINFEIFRVAMAYLGVGYDVIQEVDNKTGWVDGSGNWNGVMGLLLNGQANISAYPIPITVDRLKAVDFTAPAGVIQWGFLMKDNKADHGTCFSLSLDFLMTFYPILVVYGLVLFLLWFLLFLAYVPLSQLKFQHSPVSYVIYCIMSILRPKQHSSTTHAFLACSMLILSCEFGVLFYAAFLDANLNAAVTTKTKSLQPFEGLEQFSRLLQSGKYSLATEMSENDWRLSKVPMESGGIWSKILEILKSNPLRTFSDIATMTEAIKQNASLVYHGPLNQAMTIAAKSCDLMAFADSYSNDQWIAFALPKGQSAFRDQVSSVLYPPGDSVETLMYRLYTKYFKEVVCPERENTWAHASSLSFDQMRQLFYMLMYGYGTAIVMLLLELISHHRRGSYYIT